MIESAEALEVETIVDRRFLMDRRQFSYDHAIPERRSGKDRRERLHHVQPVVLSIIRNEEYA